MKPSKLATVFAAALAAVTMLPATVLAQHPEGGEATLRLPDLSQATFLGIPGRTLLLVGLLVCALGLGFGLATYRQLKGLPVHKAMLEISELIYETCKTYLITQGKFLLILWVFIGAIVGIYFGVLAPTVDAAGNLVRGYSGVKVAVILLFSLTGKPYPCHQIPTKSGMSVGMVLVSVELIMMLFILLFVPGDYAGPCFIGFAIGESLGAAALRIAGGIFTKIADIG